MLTDVWPPCAQEQGEEVDPEAIKHPSWHLRQSSPNEPWTFRGKGACLVLSWSRAGLTVGIQGWIRTHQDGDPLMWLGLEGDWNLNYHYLGLLLNCLPSLPSLLPLHCPDWHCLPSLPFLLPSQSMTTSLNGRQMTRIPSDNGYKQEVINLCIERVEIYYHIQSIQSMSSGLRIIV